MEIAHRAPVRRTGAEDDRPAPGHRPRAVRSRRPSGRGGAVSPRQRARSAHLDRHRLSDGAAAGGEGHPGTPRFRRRPGALRADRARPPLPPDRRRDRQGHRVRGRRARAHDARDRRAAGLRPRLAAAGTVRPQARDAGGAGRPGADQPDTAAPAAAVRARGAEPDRPVRGDGQVGPAGWPRRRASRPTASAASARSARGNLGVRLAVTAAEIDAVQALRFRVFYDEMGAQPDAAAAAARTRPRRVRRGRRPPAGRGSRDRPAARGRGRHLPADPARGGRRGSAASTRPTNTTSPRSWRFPAGCWNSAGPASMPTIAAARRCSCCGAASPPMSSSTAST